MSTLWWLLVALGLGCVAMLLGTLLFVWLFGKVMTVAVSALQTITGGP